MGPATPRAVVHTPQRPVWASAEDDAACYRRDSAPSPQQQPAPQQQPTGLSQTSRKHFEQCPTAPIATDLNAGVAACQPRYCPWDALPPQRPADNINLVQRNPLLDGDPHAEDVQPRPRDIPQHGDDIEQYMRDPLPEDRDEAALKRVRKAVPEYFSHLQQVQCAPTLQDGTRRVRCAPPRPDPTRAGQSTYMRERETTPKHNLQMLEESREKYVPPPPPPAKQRDPIVEGDQQKFRSVNVDFLNECTEQYRWHGKKTEPSRTLKRGDERPCVTFAPTDFGELAPDSTQAQPRPQSAPSRFAHRRSVEAARSQAPAVLRYEYSGGQQCQPEDVMKEIAQERTEYEARLAQFYKDPPKDTDPIPLPPRTKLRPRPR
eukprot:TRINITY_DN565_c1_g1_i2.p1 TRINITY_DN565_c1_g1~~TRINITY_DN565_c1_g1_i2.p1  ORF type:complete len:424 (+),score=104.10 TRINITY_DN565_c1_g1_i2:150-1274(+)